MADIDSTGLRVMVVDDQGTMRKILRALLNQIGIHDVVEAEDGEVAIEHLRNGAFQDPDVIICDLHMEKVSGTEFCNMVRRDNAIRDRAIPILVLTGDGDALLRDVSLQVGAATVLTKPISAPELRRNIEQAIGFTDAA